MNPLDDIAPIRLISAGGGYSIAPNNIAFRILKAAKSRPMRPIPCALRREYQYHGSCQPGRFV
jgi:hypothetical protein